MKNKLTLNGPKFHVEINAEGGALDEHERALLIVAARMLERLARDQALHVPQAVRPEEQAIACLDPAGCNAAECCHAGCRLATSASPQGQPEQAPGECQLGPTCFVPKPQGDQCRDPLEPRPMGCYPQAVKDTGCAAELVGGAGLSQLRLKQLQLRVRERETSLERARNELAEYQMRGE